MSRQMDIAEFVHRANVAKYQKILATYLMPHEREFVERRLAEERAELQRLYFRASERDLKLAG
jgi:hypothetical protein